MQIIHFILDESLKLLTEHAFLVIAKLPDLKKQFVFFGRPCMFVQYGDP